MEIKHTTTHFSYKVEEKPGGGFIARSTDPGAEPIEGATREEVMKKLEEKVAAMVHFSSEAFKLGPLDVKVNSNVNIATKTVTRQSAFATSSSLDDSQKALSGNVQAVPNSPISTSKDSTGMILRVLALVLLLGAVAYFLMHR